MRAALIAVGSELLRYGRRDTNGDWLTLRLHATGIEVRSRVVVEDDVDAIAREVRAAVESAELVILTGGLGPTADDRTRAGVAQALGLPLERDAGALAVVRAWFDSHGRPFREEQGVQADRPAGAAWVENPLGTAPGFSVDRGSSRIVALPGVPEEMKRMVDETVLPGLRGPAAAALAARCIKIGGRPESWVEAKVRELYGGGGVEVTILAGQEGIELHLRAGGEGAGSRIAAFEAAIRERIGSEIYGVDDDTLPRIVGTRLQAAGATLAVAESCTAGLLGAAVTEVPGSSAWFRGGWLVYSDDLKRSLAGVDPAMLSRHGAVSEPVARHLARAVRERCGATYGVSVTGIAGPGGGSVEKPVGTVHVAIDDGHESEHRAVRMVGDRTLVRRRTVVFALDLLRRRLERPPSAPESSGPGRA